MHIILNSPFTEAISSLLDTDVLCSICCWMASKGCQMMVDGQQMSPGSSEDADGWCHHPAVSEGTTPALHSPGSFTHLPPNNKPSYLHPPSSGSKWRAYPAFPTHPWQPCGGNAWMDQWNALKEDTLAHFNNFYCTSNCTNHIPPSMIKHCLWHYSMLTLSESTEMLRIAKKLENTDLMR